MQIIIAISGRKGSGKNTLSKSIREWYCRSYHNSSFLTQIMDEYTFECSFADNLKEFCIDTLGLTYEQCYGTDEEKNTPTQYNWESAPNFLRWKFADETAKCMVSNGATQDELMEKYRTVLSSKAEHTYHRGYMTGRDIMQIFGTDLIRQTFGNVWAEATIRLIKRRNKTLSVITDNRFPNEINAVLQEPGGYIIRLTRSPWGTDDPHPSESALDNYIWNRPKCFVLDNSNMTVKQQSKEVIPILKQILTKE